MQDRFFTDNQVYYKWNIVKKIQKNSVYFLEESVKTDSFCLFLKEGAYY